MFTSISTAAEKRAAAREEGFTLIELIVTVAIMMVLFSIALPLYLNYQRTAQLAAIRSDVRSTVVNVQRYVDTLNPSASATDLSISSNVARVNTDKSGKETIIIAGDYTNWTVTGKNIDTFGSDSSYTYSNQTGKYTATGRFGSN